MTLGEEILQAQLERAEDDKRELAKMIVDLELQLDVERKLNKALRKIAEAELRMPN